MNPRRILARLLHLAGAWTLAMAGASAGCLVTDPVPYEPAENVPPLLLMQSAELSPDPFDPVEATYERDPISGDVTWEPIPFSVPVRDYNLNDTIGYRVVMWTRSTGWQLQQNTNLRRTGRDGTVTFTLAVGPLAPERGESARCVKVVLAVTDAGYGDSPPWWAPPLDGDGNPLTEVARLHWWLLIPNPENPTARPTVDQCDSTP